VVTRSYPLVPVSGRNDWNRLTYDPDRNSVALIGRTFAECDLDF
jgi:hypothetical protein